MVVISAQRQPLRRSAAPHHRCLASPAMRSRHAFEADSSEHGEVQGHGGPNNVKGCRNQGIVGTHVGVFADTFLRGMHQFGGIKPF